ncbi:flagellar biosynthesis protein FlgL [Tabrizicola sp. J26]|uniref:flagellin n=1 Tax=Alitabrizicola rongguiensis TaxID=2909234 RepID=UPI001F476F5B|nr:flagellin [Tabrizicola rongguiensis]MCF1710618.1 flagellar biosynthesis protein FlgL [Tabrizicola rongguiensis]
MSASAIGDSARGFVLRQQTVALKAEFDRRSLEVTTGRQADIGRHLRGDLGPLAAIDSSLARAEAYLSSASTAEIRATATQMALNSLASLTEDLAGSLISVGSGTSQTAIATVAEQGRVAFDAALSTLSARIGDRSIFAGLETRGAAIASADTILGELKTAVAGLTSAGAVEAAVNSWFDGSVGYASTGYLGGDALEPIEVAEGEAVAPDVTALDPAIVDTLKGLALAALLDRGVLAGDTKQQAALVKAAGESLYQSAMSRADLSARIGIAQDRIEDAQTAAEAEKTALSTRRLSLVSADAYEAATALTETQSQLETLYSVTAKVLGLKLSDYL